MESLSDLDWNRRHMPETARLIAQAREELAELGPLQWIGAVEGEWEVGTRIETVSTGQIDIDGTLIPVDRVKFINIGMRAQKRE